jgi:pentatricopeptide repeat protein
MKLMSDQQHPVSAYSWSILVDIHAKLADFEACADIVKEMAHEGVPPPQAAYTSLLAACYRVCNDGRIPHKVRAKAGEVGWNHWQEMRIVGIDADAMAYGAIIRLCASRGQAERAINLLEEMYRFEVKPTSLCFSGALRAVARSHEIGVRFERGSSRKQLRRELIAAHHGKMARQIVIMAENAEVEQDESFVSALMLCSAAAGDSATTKAVYLASEVRKMDHLRTIGPNSSFKLLPSEGFKLSPGDEPAYKLGQGVEDSKEAAHEAGYSDRSLVSPDNSTVGGVQTHQLRRFDSSKSFGEREYGKDTRALSALLKSCGQAMGHNNLGTIWEGKSNRGYLCENSLRLITTRWEPSYTRSSIPDELSTKVGISSLRRYDENDLDEPRKKGSARKNFRGLYLDDDAEDLLDDYATVYNNDQDDDQDEDNAEVLGQRSQKESADIVSGVGRSNHSTVSFNLLCDSSPLFARCHGRERYHSVSYYPLVSWIVKWQH